MKVSQRAFSLSIKSERRKKWTKSMVLIDFGTSIFMRRWALSEGRDIARAA